MHKLNIIAPNSICYEKAILPLEQCESSDLSSQHLVRHQSL
jgi:hypothetical protein